jgi:hypothetical protein
LLGIDRRGLSVLVLEDQPPLVRTQPMARDRLGTPAMAIRPVPIEVHQVIVAPAQVLTQAIEGRGPQHRDPCGKPPLFDQIHQRPGQRAVFHIPLIGPSSDEQNVDMVLRQLGGQVNRTDAIEPSFNATGGRQGSHLRISQGLPGPGQDARIVTDDLQMQLLQPRTGRIAIEVPPRAGAEQGREGLRPPGLETRLYRLCACRLRRKGIVEKGFEIPTQLAAQLPLRARTHHRPPHRRCHRGLVLRTPAIGVRHHKPLRAFQLTDNQTVHGIAR